jgi:hypothetical protein
LRTARALGWRSDPLRRLRGQGKLTSASRAEVKLAPRASGRRDPGSARCSQASARPIRIFCTSEVPS